MSPRTAEAFAPAKINLALHVTGRRPDGYHDLDSLVVFADAGDSVRLSEAGEADFTLDGPFADAVPRGPDNLVIKALQLITDAPLSITLVKRLPPAAGLGGGSSDAAAAMRAATALTGLAMPDLATIVGLGADVPVCVTARPARMRGRGDQITPIPPLPSFHMVLVNPGQPVATSAVFRDLANADNAPLPEELPDWPDAYEFAKWLANQRNDLEGVARGIAPGIGAALAVLNTTPGCLLARMSGSGATCYGLYASLPEADAAADRVQDLQPGWWVRPISPIRPDDLRIRFT